MHELRLVKALVEDLIQRGEDEGMRRISKVYLRVGGLAEIDVPTLYRLFAEYARGTMLENAELSVEESPGREFRLLGFEGD